MIRRLLDWLNPGVQPENGCWAVSGHEERITAQFQFAGRKPVEDGLIICREEILLMEEAIAERDIPFPPRIPKERPLFNVAVKRGAATRPVPSAPLPALEVLDPAADIDTVCATVQAVANGRHVVISGSAPRSLALADMLTAAMGPGSVTRVEPGYGAATAPIRPGLLHRPGPGSFFSWLLQRGRLKDIGAVVLAGDGDLSVEQAAVMDAGDPPPLMLWLPDGGLARQTAPAPVTWPRISMILPSFNQARFIEATIRSVIDQGYPNLEFIVVDGGSSDGSVEIIERYREHFAKIVIEPDDGQSDAINKGFGLATGEVMNWICSDDLLEPDALFRIGEVFARTGADLIAGGCARIGEARDIEYFRHHTALEIGRSTPLDPLDILMFMRSWQSGAYFFQPEVFFSRRIWEAAGAYVKRHLFYVMDYDMWFRMGLAGASIRHIPAMIGCSRVHDAQKTQDNQQYLHQTRQLMQEYADLFGAVLRALPPPNTRK